MLYVLANTNAMNGDVVGYTMAAWQKVMYVIDAVILVLIILSGIMVFRKAKRKANAA